MVAFCGNKGGEYLKIVLMMLMVHLLTALINYRCQWICSLVP